MGNNLIKFNFDYSREDDVLILSRPKGKSKEIIESSDFIIYGLDRKGGLNHLEISGAKDFFKTIAPKLNLDFLEEESSGKVERHCEQADTENLDENYCDDLEDNETPLDFNRYE